MAPFLESAGEMVEGLLELVSFIFDQKFRRGRRPMLKPNDVAPDFEVKDHHGKAVRLADFKGKRVVLWFYPKADTPG